MARWRLEVLHAYTVKEDQRSLLALTGTTPDPELISHRLWKFYDNTAASSAPEIHRVAATVEIWWPAIEAANTGEPPQPIPPKCPAKFEEPV